MNKNERSPGTESVGQGTSPRPQENVPDVRVGEMILKMGVSLKALAIFLLVSRAKKLGWF